MASAKTFRWTPFPILAVLLFFVPGMALSQTFVQVSNNPSAANTDTVSVTYPASETAGDLNVVIIGWSDTISTVTSVTDDNGNTYQLAAGTNASSGESQVIYFAKNITLPTNPTPTVTVTFNQVAAAPDVRIVEYSGLDPNHPLDVSVGAGGSGASASSGAATTTNATDVILGAGTISSYFTGPGAGFTKRIITSPFGDIVEDKNVAAAGSYSATATTAGGNWAMQMVAFSTTSVASTLPAVSSITPTSGPDTGGTAISITGTGFQPGAVVLFSGISAVNCTVVNSTTINCTTPAHGSTTGVVDVTVQNVDGQNNTLAGAFTYTKSTPAVNKVTPAQGITNGGNLLTITGTSFVAPASVTIDGTPASNVTVVNSTTITASAPADAVGPADVIVTNGDGGTSPALTGGYTYILGSGPVNFIQAAGVGASTGLHSSLDVTLPNPQTAGDLTVVIVGWGDTTANVASVSDDGNNTYTQAVGTTRNLGNGLSQTIYYAKNIQSSKTIHVTFSPSAGAVAPDVRVLEYRGLDQTSPLDTNTAAAAVNFGTGKVADSGPVTTSFTNNVIVGGAMVGQTVVSAGSNFVMVDRTNDGNAAIHQFNSSAVNGAHAVANLSPSSAWVIQAVSFHANPSVPTPDFALTASPASASVNPGSSASYTISAASQGGFTGSINLSCTAPANVQITCNVKPASITAGGAPATLTVTTAGPTAALFAPRQNRLSPLYAVLLPLPAIALAGIGGCRKRKLAIGLTVFLVLALTLLLAGCGGGGSSNGGGGGGGGGTGGTAAGTYSITVTGASGSLSHQTSVSLTVQ